MPESNRPAERTGKGWKLTQLIGALPAAGGFALFLSGFWMDSIGASAMAGGLIAMTLGTPVYLVGRIGGWWFYG